MALTYKGERIFCLPLIVARWPISPPVALPTRHARYSPLIPGQSDSYVDTR